MDGGMLDYLQERLSRLHLRLTAPATPDESPVGPKPTGDAAASPLPPLPPPSRWVSDPLAILLVGVCTGFLVAAVCACCSLFAANSVVGSGAPWCDYRPARGAVVIHRGSSGSKPSSMVVEETDGGAR